ncbi:MAG: MFS transporter, partial [Aestuariibacter sp.]|nr:MFS transporter [Aestuariibacter sp.]
TISRNLLIALCATFISFCTLYTPQPMLPLLAAQFNISSSSAGLLMTATMLPLGLAPIVYGYFLQAIPAKLMLTVALALLMLDQLAFYLASEFWHLLLLRGVQGFLLPAIFTALMTYCASMVAAGQVRRVMGLYVAATILGGYLGRVIGGYFASEYTWQAAYLVMGFVLLIPIVLMRFAKADAEISFARLDIRSISRVLSERNYRLVFMALAAIFFVYAGILNLIPFRLYALDPSISPFSISNLYIGYLIGIPIALFSQSFSGYIGDERRSLMLGLGLNGIGLLAFFVSDISILFVMLFCFAGGFFFIHSTLSGLVNHMALEHKGVVNGLYVSVYYLSGALASWFPGIVYDIYGWEMVMLLFIILLLVSGWIVSKLRLAPVPSTT